MFTLREVHSLLATTGRIGTVYVRVAGRAAISTVPNAGEVGIHARVIVLRASGTLGTTRNPQSRLEEAGGEKRIGDDG